MCAVKEINQEMYNTIASCNPVMFIGATRDLTAAKHLVDQGIVSTRLMRQAVPNHGTTKTKYHIHYDEMAELGYIFAEKPFSTEVYAFDASGYSRNIRMHID